MSKAPKSANLDLPINPAVVGELSRHKQTLELVEQEKAAHPMVTIPSSKATSLLQAITAAAADPATDIDKMERLFAMHERMVAAEAEAAFNAAMARAQAKIAPIATNAFNDHTKSRYAKLDAINIQVVPAYTSEGLSVSFDTEPSALEGHIRVVAIVSHAAGHTRRFHLDAPLDAAGSAGKVNKTGIQALGSTIQYSKRYLICEIFNVAITNDRRDTDGNEEGSGLSPERYDALKKSITDTMTKAAAVAAWQAAMKECEGDIDAANGLKAVHADHRRFLDGVSKKEGVGL